MIGASGRMGREIMQLIYDNENTVLVGAAGHLGSE